MDDLVDSLPSMQALLQHRAATINMAAGPSALPTSVLLQATSGLLDYANTGMGLAELSHRGAPFQACLKDAEKDLRQLLAVPDDFAVLFLQGGGLTQFSMAPLNLVSAWKAKNKSPKEPKCEYVVSGSWSAKAAGEARRLGMDVNVVIDGREPSKGGEGSKKGAFGEQQLPPSEQWNWTSKADDEELPAFIYYCSNETVNGVEIPPPTVPAHLKDVPLCADMSSNILSRPIPWTTANFGLVYAGAQKNVGPSGLTLVFVRKDLIVDPDEAVQYNGPRIPAMLAYKSHADNGSLYNTPSMFPIYVAGLVFKHLQQMGGVKKIEEINIMKAQAVYKAVDESDGFYQARVISSLRSRMNICFGLPNAEGREERFIKEAEKAGIKQIKGHRCVLRGMQQHLTDVFAFALAPLVASAQVCTTQSLWIKCRRSSASCACSRRRSKRSASIPSMVRREPAGADTRCPSAMLVEPGEHARLRLA